MQAPQHRNTLAPEYSAENLVKEVASGIEKPAYFLNTEDDRKPPSVLPGIG